VDIRRSERRRWTRRPRRRANRSGHRRRLLLAGAAAVVAFGLTSALWIVWPQTSGPERADAIVVLSGSGPREAHGLALASEGYAPVVLFSLGALPTMPCPERAGVRVVCFVPDPVDTRGEAELASRYALAHHWNRLLIVPGRFQATRAALLFHRCYTGTIFLSPASQALGSAPYLFLYQWGALLKAALVVRSC
jgi:uncharacterized SAM-binding protein YcdF (DUF218 family)